MEPHRPQQGAERVGAAREEAADDSGENVAAAGDSEARRAALIGPAFARRGDDMAGDAFDEDNGAVEFGGADSAADGIPVDLQFIAVEQRRELARMREQDRGRRAISIERPQRVKQRGVERDPCAACDERLGDAPAVGVVRHSRTGDDCVDLLGLFLDSARLRGVGQADDHRLGHGDSDLRRDALDGRDLELSRPRAHGRGSAQRRRAGNLAATGDDQDPTLGFLVAIDHRRQRLLVERASVERDPAHRVPVMASGADVLDAPCFSSGAP